MTARTRILLLALALTAFMLCACLGDDGERMQWQREVLSRQRGLERPAERTERDGTYTGRVVLR